ncbi:MAG: Uma2 family endonuclease [Chloroflexi bacterium]|nr:Uma2 family endonuclease [Chloroflexota bacterium]
MVVQKKVYTADDFEAFIRQPANRDRRFELINGEVVEKVPTQKHGIITLNIGAEMRALVKARGLGRVAVEARYRPHGDNLNDLIPDISYMSDLSRPVTEEGPVPGLPDLAVEVKSPDDTFRQMRDKARFYLANGARMVWLVFPDQRVIEVYTPDDEYVLGEGEALTGGEVLPGFEMPVSAVFEV